jgi:hypothetical protein
MEIQTDAELVPPVELVRQVRTGGDALLRNVHLIGTEAGAAEIAETARGVITAAQELLGVAEHVVGDITEDDHEATPAEFEGEWAQITADRTYAFGEGGHR